MDVMKYEDVMKYKDKRVKILLKQGYRYTGIILSMSEECINIRDRYNNLVTIDLVDISLITEDHNVKG